MYGVFCLSALQPDTARPGSLSVASRPSRSPACPLHDLQAVGASVDVDYLEVLVEGYLQPVGQFHLILVVVFLYLENFRSGIG